MLETIYTSEKISLYKRKTAGNVEQYIATTAGTRAICNDPLVAGLAYTNALRQSCADILAASDFGLQECSTVVVNILRGGLNFGLREALGMAFGWNRHTTCFLSAQRARNTNNPEDWHITENSYRKLYFPHETSFVIGDVVATGTSLRYALLELGEEARRSGTLMRNLVFFTYGGSRAAEILQEADERYRSLFPNYGRSILIFLEGCFTVPTPESPLTIRLTGTDLVRREAEMAPEFIESQYGQATYPIERCTIYDAGSRAFHVREYSEDVVSYWKQVLELAEHGVTFGSYLAERFPELDSSRFQATDLRQMALDHLAKLNSTLF